MARCSAPRAVSEPALRVVVLTRLHKPVPHLVYSKRTVARRILKYLEEIGQGPTAGVKDVYFGHTHKQLKNYRHGGLIFHNGGVAIKGMKFRILEANIDDARCYVDKRVFP